jgi:RNA polymerase sigma-70 factor (ECF subfamily)
MAGPIYLGYMRFYFVSGTVVMPLAARTVVEILHGFAASLPKEPADTGSIFAIDDIQDIQNSRQGDSEAYRRLIERHQAHVARILWRFTRDRAVHEELVQDVFVEAYLSLHSYRAKSPFANWLARIATRIGYRYWKQTAGRAAVESFSLEQWDQVVGHDQMAERIEPNRAAELLHNLLQQLPPRDRLILTLRYLDDCDVTETARRTGWTKTMVKVQTLRARKKLQRLFERYNQESLE